MRQPRIDETFLGARDVPFTVTQTDLLAAHLAHELTCAMQRRIADDYIVAADLREPTAEALHGTVELISNNLAGRQALTLSNDETRTNSVLSGKAHQIDGVLYQYWLTVTPQDEDDDIAALSASAYIVLPESEMVATATPDPVPTAPRQVTVTPASISIPNAGKDSLITPLQLVAPSSSSDCRYDEIRIQDAGYMMDLRTCSLLRTRAQADSIVFFLQHQANHGLVRLAGTECRDRTAARIARRGESLSFPIAKTTTLKQNWSETYDWLLEPELDTYYAVVVTDARLARRVANHMDDLPLRCSTSFRPGLEDDALREWLSDFAMIAARSSDHVDWRAVKVKDVL